MSEATLTGAAAAEVADILERAEVDARASRVLPLVTIFVHDEYENYDLDAMPPRTRLRALGALREAGFEARTGHLLVRDDDGLRVRFPRPVRTLGADPSDATRALLREEDSVGLATPTQALLALLHLRHRVWGATEDAEARALVSRHPANLPKIREWSRAAGFEDLVEGILEELREAQRQGIRDRKQRRSRPVDDAPAGPRAGEQWGD